MKKLFTGALLALAALAASGQSTIPISAIDPHIGFIRKGPCGAGAGDNCGGVVNVTAPTFQITPAMCGTVFSTSNARNADGSQSTEGTLFLLPTVEMFEAAGYTPAGAAASSGFANREGQCMISFVQGLPAPTNYLRIGIRGQQGIDKITFHNEGIFHDIWDGDVRFYFVGSAAINFGHNGTSWLGHSGGPGLLEQIGYGQMASHGQGRLFLVTQDPPWWTAGTRVGTIAWCPLNGNGIAVPSNGGVALQQVAPNCIFADPGSTTTTEWYGVRNVGSIIQTSVIAAGAAYPAGTAPNGRAYPAGNYAVVPVTAFVGGYTGNTVVLHNLPTTLGTQLNGKWIVKVLTTGAPGCTVAICLELHQSINESQMFDVSHVGPPSNFIPGDTLRAGVVAPVAGGYLSLVSMSGATSRFTNPANGVEEDALGRLRAVVGIARRETGIGFSDTITKRFVASMFNPVLKKCQSAPPSDFTTSSATFVEVSTAARCNFVYINGISTHAASLGDTGRRVQYNANISSGNNTAAAGCEYAIGFGQSAAAWSGTPEPEVPGYINPTGVTGGRHALSINGAKVGLPEALNWGTLLVRAVGGGTCTTYAANTNWSLLIPQ